MSTLSVRVLLFLSSYFPLALIFFVLYLKKNPIAAYSSLALGILGVLGLVVYIRIVSRLGPVPINISSINRRDGESMSYIVTYVIPFLALPSDDHDKDIALMVFFVVLAIIYVNSQMIHINPMLNAMGFHLYDVAIEGGSNSYLISRRRRIRRGTILNVISLTEDIYFERSA